MAALYEQRLDLLGEATQDRLTSPPRLLACEAAASAYRAALDAGAAAAWLSGSGPTVAVVAAEDRVAPVTAALVDSGAVLELPIDQLGAMAV